MSTRPQYYPDSRLRLLEQWILGYGDFRDLPENCIEKITEELADRLKSAGDGRLVYSDPCGVIETYEINTSPNKRREILVEGYTIGAPQTNRVVVALDRRGAKGKK